MSVISSGVNGRGKGVSDPHRSEQAKAMIECKELAGKVVQACTIFEDDNEGPDVQLDFTDGTSFTLNLRTKAFVEAKCLSSDGGEPETLKDYTAYLDSR